MRDRHARLSHGSVNGLPSTAAAETKTRNCPLGRGASARACHCFAGRRSCARYQLSEGWRRGWHDPPTVGFFDPPIEPAGGAEAATRPVPSPRPDRQRRVQLDRNLRLRTASLSGRLGAGHEPQQSSSSRAAHRRGGVHHRPRSQHWSMLGNTDISHGREPVQSTTEVARVTLRHTRRSEYLEAPSTRVDTRSRGHCLVGGTPLPSAS